MPLTSATYVDVSQPTANSSALGIPKLIAGSSSTLDLQSISQISESTGNLPFVLEEAHSLPELHLCCLVDASWQQHDWPGCITNLNPKACSNISRIDAHCLIELIAPNVTQLVLSFYEPSSRSLPTSEGADSEFEDKDEDEEDKDEEEWGVSPQNS
ncbi:hypothetical protein CROQUDRAFT_86960 [Cronartium quercuum f. sp. fusiforme G11]|uniref:Uncharacterized protein n=1 Tax=Cronartium quercuum f. sp. fusiforme G11 TaxID=708437 RepID=A0A9P6NPX9_9BASI|nr:hypothetical protein CROQUDRAFT_86960 [Cronartium quercuum f. sp. fusiforme G11]